MRADFCGRLLGVAAGVSLNRWQAMVYTSLPRRGRTSIAFYGCLAGTLVLLAKPSVAQNSDDARIIVLQVGTCGPLMVAHPGNWNRFTVLLENKSDSKRSVVAAARGIGARILGRFNYAQAVELAPKSRREVTFPIQLPADMTVSTERPLVEVELLEGGRRIDSLRIPFSFVDPKSEVLGLIGTQGGMGLVLHARVLHERSAYRTVITTSSMANPRMPDEPLSLDVFDWILVEDPQRVEFSSTQWSALERWTAAGGNLIVMVSSPESIRGRPELWSWLPVRALGNRRVTVLPASAEWAGSPLRAARGMDICESVRLRGETLLADGENPLVVRSTAGLGTVTYVGIGGTADLFNSFSFRAFWVRLLEELRRPRPLDVSHLRPHAPQLMEGFAGRQFVGIWFPLVFTGTYLVVMALLLRYTAVAQRFSFAWLSVLAAAVLFAVVGTGAASWFADEAGDALFDIWVARGASDTRTARIQSQLSLFTQERGDKTIRIQGESVRPIARPRTAAQLIDAYYEPEATQFRLHLDKGEPSLLEGEGYLDLMGLQVRAKVGNEVLEVELSNETDFDLSASFLKLGRKDVEVGDLPVGQTRTLKLDSSVLARGSARFEESGVLDKTAKLRRSILSQLFVESRQVNMIQELAGRDLRARTSSTPWFLGWTERATLPVFWSDVGTEPVAGRRRSLGLIAVRPTFEVVEQRFTVPKGLMTLHLPNMGVGQVYIADSRFVGSRPINEALQMQFALPEWAASARIREANLTVDFESDAFQLAAFLDGKRLELPDRPTGRFALPANALGGQIPLRFVVQPRPEFEEGNRWDSQTWFLNEVDIDCVCETQPDATELPR